MISIKSKLRVPPVPAPPAPTPDHDELNPTFKVTAYLPETTPQSIGHEFNLVRIVEDHGPKRITAIEKEIAKLEQQIATLTKEKNQIAAFIATLGAP